MWHDFEQVKRVVEKFWRGIFHFKLWSRSKMVDYYTFTHWKVDQENFFLLLYHRLMWRLTVKHTTSDLDTTLNSWKLLKQFNFEFVSSRKGNEKIRIEIKCLVFNQFMSHDSKDGESWQSVSQTRTVGTSPTSDHPTALWHEGTRWSDCYRISWTVSTSIWLRWCVSKVLLSSLRELFFFVSIFPRPRLNEFSRNLAVHYSACNLKWINKG